MRHIPGNNTQPANPLAGLFDNADRAMGFDARYRDDGSVRAVIPQRAADIKRLDLRVMQVPSFANTALNHTYIPTAPQAGKDSTIDTAILAGSRCAMAGAQLLIVEEAPEPVQAHDSMIVYPRNNMQLHIVRPAPFAVVADGNTVTNSAVSDFLSTALVDLETMPQVSFRVALSRAERRAYENGLIEDATLVAIALGLARAVDATLLGALEAAGLSAFTLAKAAAASLAFDELTGITSGAATGLAVNQDGKLRAAGIISELSADATATTVGSFARSGVAVHRDLTLLAERTSADGDLVLTAWANMQALLPAPTAYFWSVA
jgi:hypothetical protein